MERPKISSMLLEAAASYSIYEDTLRQLKEAQEDLVSGDIPVTKQYQQIQIGRIEMLENIAKERLQEYHTTMDTVQSLHALILVP